MILKSLFSKKSQPSDSKQLKDGKDTAQQKQSKIKERRQSLQVKQFKEEKQTAGQKNYFCVKRSFLEPKNFKSLYENALKLNKSYQVYAQTIQNYFKSFNQYCSHLQEPNQQKIRFLYYFKKYFYDYSKIMKQITGYQLSCFQINRQKKNDESLTMALHLIIQDSIKFSPFQLQIRQKKERLTKQFTAIKGQYLQINKKMKQPKYYYDKKYMRSQFQPLKSKIQANQKAQQQILSQIIKVNQNTNVFVSQIDAFRKQLLKNKYKYHKKLLDLAINSKQSLAELFFYQYNCMSDYYAKISDAMKIQEDQFSTLRADKNVKYLTSDPSSCINVITKNSEDFTNLLQSIQNDLNSAAENFLMISKKMKQFQQKNPSKVSFQNINKFFELDESPGQILLNTMNSFEWCFKKLTEKYMDCIQAAKQIETIRKQVSKHNGITVSLLRVKLKNGGLQTIRNIVSNQVCQDECGVYQFINSLDLKPVKAVVQKCLDKMLNTFRDILNYFSQSNLSSKKLGISDSMELSYIQKSLIQIKKKKPIKDQLWLWDEHRKKIDTQFTVSRQLFNQVIAAFELFKDQEQVDLDTQKYECFCQSLQQAGQLSLSKKAIKFTSKSGQRQLCIPIKEIQQIKRKFKVLILNSIFIHTKIGQLVFKHFQDSEQVQIALKQCIQSGGATPGSIPKRPKIQLTEQQRQKVQSPARKQQVQKIRKKQANFVPFFERSIQKFTIDQFYDLIFSDKKFALTGKQHESFMSYAMKQMKNQSFKCSNYAPPGPKYYTLDENTTFANGPLSSNCQYEYKHLIDIFGMPPSVTNNQTRTVFWVSDKQIDYLIHSKTSGVPASDYFYVQLLYKVKEQDQNLSIKTFGQLTFTESTILKGTIQKSTWPQMKSGTGKTLDIIQRTVQTYKSALSGKKIQQEAQPQNIGESAQSQMQKLRTRNLIMMIVIVAIVLLNIIVKIFF